MQQENEINIIKPDRPSKRKKKGVIKVFLIIVGLVILIFLIVIFYLSFDIKSILGQKSSTESENQSRYSLETLGGSQINGVKPIHIEQKCYGLVVPYAIFKSTQRDTCSVFISLRSPKGNVTVDYRPSESADVLPDIKMRRLRSDKYIESQTIVNDTLMLIFQNIESEGYEKTAFFEKSGAHIAITLKTETMSADREKVFEEILKSFYCIENCRYKS